MFQQRALKCFTTEFCPKTVPENVATGGKVFLPPSTLEFLSRTNVSYPLLFEVKNEKENLSLQCGILEFTAEEGRAYLPAWMMKQLKAENGKLLSIKYKNAPLGRFVKIQPQSESFLDISNPRAVLENSLKNFSCLSVGDMISIQYNSKTYDIKVLEAKPANSISIVEADIEVDFAPPPGYVEPSRKVPEPASSPVEEVPSTPAFVPFSGGGRSLSGRQASPVGGSPSPSPAANRSPTPKSAPSSPPKTPASPAPFSFNPSLKAAPVAVQPGKLIFGKIEPARTVAPGTSTAQPAEGRFRAFSGAGNSLKSN